MLSHLLDHLLLFRVVPEDGHVAAALIGRNQQRLAVRLDGQGHKGGWLGGVEAVDLLPRGVGVRSVVGMEHRARPSALGHRDARHVVRIQDPAADAVGRSASRDQAVTPVQQVQAVQLNRVIAANRTGRNDLICRTRYGRLVLQQHEPTALTPRELTCRPGKLAEVLPLPGDGEQTARRRRILARRCIELNGGEHQAVVTHPPYLTDVDVIKTGDRRRAALLQIDDHEIQSARHLSRGGQVAAAG